MSISKREKKKKKRGKKKEKREQVADSTLATSFNNTCLPEETGNYIPLDSCRRKIVSSKGKFSLFYGLKITERTNTDGNLGNVE